MRLEKVVDSGCLSQSGAHHAAVGEMQESLPSNCSGLLVMLPVANENLLLAPIRAFGYRSPSPSRWKQIGQERL